MSNSSTVREFIARSLRPWRFRVWTAHAASLLLGLITAVLGIAIGPGLQSLFAPQDSLVPWNHILGAQLAEIFSSVLPPEGAHPQQLALILPYVLLGAATIKAVTLFYQWYSWELLGERLAWGWRRDLVEDFRSVDPSKRDDIKDVEAELGGAIAQDIRSLREFVVHYYGGLPREGLQILFTAAALIALSPKLFAIFALGIAPVGALVSKAGKKLRRRASKALSDNSFLSEWIQQRLLGLETIKHYRTEKLESEAMLTASQNLFYRFLQAAKVKSRTSPAIELFGIIAMSVALWVAFADIASGAISGGIVMSFFSNLALLAQSAGKLGRYLNSNNEGTAAGQRLLQMQGLLQAARTQAANPRVQLVPGDQNRLVLQNVTISYSTSKPAVSNVSYDFQGGKIYCLVGRSGAGKSTIFNSILGLRTIDSGKMSGTFAKAWSDRSLDLVSMPQQVQLVPTTLGRNVSYPHLNYDPAKAQKALAEAQFDLSGDSRLANGLETKMGADGLQLSGGQAQRLQLARVIYHHSPFVLVDEGTSALDPTTEAEVLKSLRRLADTGICVIMIAHRRAAAEQSDEILVMDQGQLIDHGKPTAILNSEIAKGVFGH